MIRSIVHNLPGFIYFEGITFQLAILGTNDKALRITYIISNINANSPHYITHRDSGGKWLNRFDNNTLSKSLITSKDIRTDADFRINLHFVRSFLKSLGIIDKPILKTYEYDKKGNNS